MPFRSKRQFRWAFATGQPFARRWARMQAYRRLPERAPAAKADVVETPSGAAPPGTGTPGQRTPSERARLAALARWEKYRAGEDQPKRGRGRVVKPRLTPEEQEVQRRREAQRNRAAALSSQGVDAVAQAAMEALAMGRDPEDASGLLTIGLAERGADGVIRLTTEGRQAYNAAGRGDAGLVREILGKAKDRLAQAEAAEALARKKEEERAQKEEARAGRKRGGGGGASEEEKERRREEARRKREEERQAAIVERRAATAEAVGLAAEALEVLVRARDEGGVDDDDLRALGFIDEDGEATAEGRRALAALERGDRGAYRAALQQARRRMVRVEDEQEEDSMSDSLKALDFATRLDLVRIAVLDALHRAEAYDPDDAAMPGVALVHAHGDDDNEHDDIAIYVYDEFAVACLGAGEDVKIPYTVEDGDVMVADPNEWRLIEWEPVERGAYRAAAEDAAPVAIKALDDTLLAIDGGAVKALSDGRTSGYLIRFGDAASSGDLSPYRDIFTRATDYGSAKTSDVYVHHRLLPGLGKRQLKHQATLRLDEVGVFIEHLLDLRDPFERALYELAQKGKLGWSSGTAAHLVERKALGDGRHIVEKWPLGLDASYTPTPAGGLDMTVALKSLFGDPQVAAGSDAQDAEASEASEAARRRRLLLELDLLELEDTHV